MQYASPSRKDIYIQSAKEAAVLPLVAMGLFLILAVCWRAFEWPTPEEMFDLIVKFFSEYGGIVIFLGALGEGVAIVNLYFPGSAAILLGMAASKGMIPQAISVVVIASLGFALAAQLNYAIGFFGLYPILYRLGGRKLLMRSERRYKERGASSLFWGYIHPNIGGVLAVSAGMARLNWFKFTLITSLSIIVWNTVWGGLVYLAARPVQRVATSPYLVLIGLSLWLGIAVAASLLRAWRKDRRDTYNRGVQNNVG